MRQTRDYEDIYGWNQEDIMPLIPLLESLLNKIIELVNNFYFNYPIINTNNNLCIL